MINEHIQQSVFDALEDNRYKWRTIKGIAKQLGITKEEVLNVIENNKDSVVQSSVPSIHGSPLYTTRKHFHEMSTPFEKIVGAFKGRIR